MCTEINFVVLPQTVVTFGFGPTEYEVVEGGTVMATVELIGETNIDVVVNVATQDMTASGEQHLSFASVISPALCLHHHSLCLSNLCLFSIFCMSFSQSFTIAHTPTQSLSHSLIHSLTQSLTHTNTLTHSLTEPTLTHTLTFSFPPSFLSFPPQLLKMTTLCLMRA